MVSSFYHFLREEWLYWGVFKLPCPWISLNNDTRQRQSFEPQIRSLIVQKKSFVSLVFYISVYQASSRLYCSNTRLWRRVNIESRCCNQSALASGNERVCQIDLVWSLVIEMWYMYSVATIWINMSGLSNIKQEDDIAILSFAATLITL